MELLQSKLTKIKNGGKDTDLDQVNASSAATRALTTDRLTDWLTDWLTDCGLCRVRGILTTR